MSTTLTLAERAVPRYASYPTAPHFSAAVGANTYAEWLAALPDAAKLSSNCRKITSGTPSLWNADRPRGDGASRNGVARNDALH